MNVTFEARSTAQFVYCKATGSEMTTLSLRVPGSPVVKEDTTEPQLPQSDSSMLYPSASLQSACQPSSPPEGKCNA